MRTRFILASLLLVSATAWAASPSVSNLQARRDALKKLLAEQWEYTLSNSPEFASILGDKRWNDKISDSSQAAIDADLAKTAGVPPALPGDRHHRLPGAGEAQPGADGARPRGKGSKGRSSRAG